MKRKLKIIFLFSIWGYLSSSCGQHPNKYVDCVDGCNGEHRSGYEEDKDDPKVIIGSRGPRGESGSSCSVLDHEQGAIIVCDDDTSQIIIDGAKGQDGQDGESCSIQRVSNGAVITCGDDTVAIFDGMDGVDGRDGVDGEDGQDAAPGAYSITELIDPCGKEANFDEILLRTANGQLMALYFDTKKKAFLTVITPGNYVTTDGTDCYFSVDSELEVTW